MLTDRIGDMLTRIRNANKARHDSVLIPASKLKLAIIDILKQEKFIKDYEFIKDNKQGMIKVYLRYGPNKEKLILGLKRISKPSRRIYVKYKDIPVVRAGRGIAILSTSQGVMIGEEAKKRKIGGELLCLVW